MEKWQYYGLFIDKETHDKLIDVLVDYHWIGTLNDSEKEYLDHCTLLHKSQEKDSIKNFCELCLGANFIVRVTGIGISNKALAFKVEIPGVPCANKIPHITICTFNGGKPVDSNNITKWYDLDEPIKIETTLKRV